MIFATGLLNLALLSFASAATFTNPLRKSGPDPFIVYDHATSSYLFMQTSGNALRVTQSPTLDGIRDVANQKEVYSDAQMKDKPSVWAGEIHNIGGKWYIYYSHMDAIWVVSGTSDPMGEYRDPVRLYDRGWSLDNTVLKVGDKNYMVFSCHSKDVSDNTIGGSSLCIAPMTSPTKIDQSRTTVISRPEETWEQSGGFTNEGPQPIYWAGQIYIIYSASFCSTPDYSLGLIHLTSNDPLDPASWTKKKDGPVFKSGNGYYGPGHNGMFMSPDGTELWTVYHATWHSEGQCGDDRSTFAMKVDTTNGLNFGSPVTEGTYEGPSGEGGGAVGQVLAADIKATGSNVTATATKSHSRKPIKQTDVAAGPNAIGLVETEPLAAVQEGESPKCKAKRKRSRLSFEMEY